MTFEEAMVHWRSADEPQPAGTSDDAALLAAVKARSDALDRTIRRRDRRETIASSCCSLCLCTAGRG